MTGLDTNTVQIDVKKIPAFRGKELAEEALRLVEQVFSLPGAEEKYQAWLAKRKGGEKK